MGMRRKKILWIDTAVHKGSNKTTRAKERGKEAVREEVTER